MIIVDRKKAYRGDRVVLRMGACPKITDMYTTDSGAVNLSLSNGLMAFWNKDGTYYGTASWGESTEDEGPHGFDILAILQGWK